VVVENRRTFSLLVFVHKHFRFIAYQRDDQGAAQDYSISRFLSHASAILSIKNSKIVFIEAFFSEHNPQVALKALDMCADAGVVTSFNLCGEAVVEEHFEKSIEPFLRRCDVVVGNLIEFNHVCAKLNISTEHTEQAALHVHKVMMMHILSTSYRVKSLETCRKILVVTNGDKGVLCVTNSHGLINYLPPRLESSKIKDTNGAGDSFIAGFLYALLQEQPILKCLEIACRVAGEIIQQYGITLPEKKIDFLKDD